MHDRRACVHLQQHVLRLLCVCRRMPGKGFAKAHLASDRRAPLARPHPPAARLPAPSLIKEMADRETTETNAHFGVHLFHAWTGFKRSCLQQAMCRALKPRARLCRQAEQRSLCHVRFALLLACLAAAPQQLWCCNLAFVPSCVGNVPCTLYYQCTAEAEISPNWWNLT